MNFWKTDQAGYLNQLEIKLQIDKCSTRFVHVLLDTHSLASHTVQMQPTSAGLSIYCAVPSIYSSNINYNYKWKKVINVVLKSEMAQLF